MRSRVIGAVLCGLGVLALVFAAGLAFVVGPRRERLPYDLDRTQSVAEAPDATFLQISDGQVAINSADLRSTITVQPDTQATADLEGDLDGEAVVWLVGQQVIRTDTNDLISAYSTSLALDRVSAAAVPWEGQWLDTGNERQSADSWGRSTSSRSVRRRRRTRSSTVTSSLPCRPTSSRPKRSTGWRPISSPRRSAAAGRRCPTTGCRCC